MADFTPYGDPFERVNKLLSSLDADAASLERESAQLGSTVDEVEKSRARLSRQAESQIGRTGARGGVGGTSARATTEEAAAQRRLVTARESDLRTLQRQRLYTQSGRQPYLKSLKTEEEQLGRINALRARGGILLGSEGQIIPGQPYSPRDRNLALPGGAERRPPLPIVGGTTEQARTTQKARIETERYGKTLGKVTGAERNWSAATRSTLAAQTAASRNLRSYGALTTEFFASASRGTVTLRELGFQTTATIQKFGGWLGAGAAIYTALGAVVSIGRGAIDSSSGVDQLSRVVNNVDPSQTTAKFRELAKSFNLPIGTVAEAAYQMGKVFHDQNKALEASQSILYAVKVGELDVATASRYLTAVVQGFNLTAEEQQTVFDQVNQAQNKYSVSIDSLLAGTSKAAGSFRAAGGDATHLIALITTLSKVSGQTGNIIGTAIQRSPHFINLEQNRKVLEGFGLDVNEPIEQLYANAIKIAQGKSGDFQRKLAEALFGPQYGARVGIFLFQQSKLYSKVLGDVQPEKAKGSAQRELNSVLGQADERLKAVINSLEVLGSNLESAGAFDALKVGLGALQGMFDVANGVLEVFNKLPGPLKQVVLLATQAGLVLKGLRFFNVGQSFGGEGTAVGRFLTSPNQKSKLYKDLLIQQEEALAGKLQQQTGRAASLALTGQGAQAQLIAAKTAQAQAEAVYGVTSKEALAASEATLATQRRLDGVNQALADSELQQTIIKKEQLLNAEQQALLTKRTTSAQAESIAGAYGVVIPGSAGTYADEAAGKEARLRKNISQKIEAGGTGPIILPSGVEVARDVVESEAQTLKKLTSDKQGFTNKLKQLNKEGGGFGAAAGALALAGREASSKAKSARSSIGKINLKAIPKAFRGLRKSLAAMLGPLDVLILSALFLPEIADGLTNRVDRIQSEIDSAQGQARSPKDLQNKIDSLINQSDEITDVPPITDPLGRLGYVGGKITGAIDEESEAAAQTAEVLTKRRAEVREALLRGEFIVSPSSFFKEDVKPTTGRYLEGLKSGALSTKEFGQNMRELFKTIRASLPEADARAVETEARLSVINAKGLKSNYQELAAVAGKELQKRLDAYSELVGSGFGSGKDVSALIRSALPQIARALRSKDPEKRKYAAKGLDSLIEGIQQNAQQELDTALTFAKGQAERNKAYGRYLQTVNPRQVTKVFEQQRRQLQTQLNREERSIGAVQKAEPDTTPKYGSAQKEISEYRKDLNERRDKAKDTRKELNALDKAQAEARRKLRQITKELRDKRFQENEQFYEAKTEFKISQLPEGIGSLRYQLTRIRKQIGRAIKHYGRNSQEVLKLLTTEQGLLAEEAQTQIDLISAQGEYRASLINPETNPIDSARAQLNTAEQILTATKRDPHASRADILGASTAVNQARFDLANEVRNQAEEVKDATFELARAKAGGNEVAEANIDVREARYKVRNARTRAEKLQAQAGLINARRSKQESVASRQIENIEFQADLGKLTTEQEIRAYERLLRTLNLTRDIRRDLRRKIHDLKSEGEDDQFDLNVGDIKLPTIYEVKRAIGGGVLGGPRRTSVTTTNNIRVEANGANADEVVQKLHRTLDGTNDSALKSAGLI